MESTVPFITVEGPIGVGKTSLASLLANHFQYFLLQEIYEENPFLTKFYENLEEWSFQTEMFFLTTRYKQLEDVDRHHIQKNHPVVADYHIFKNLIFSKMTLTSAQYRKYQEIYRILISDMPMANVIIYLRAGLGTLLRRIELRGRGMEKNISHTYLDQLSHDYDRYIGEFQMTHPDVTVLTFDVDSLDFVNRRQDFEFILSKVTSALRPQLLQTHSV